MQHLVLHVQQDIIVLIQRQRCHVQLVDTMIRQVILLLPLVKNAHKENMPMLLQQNLVRPVHLVKVTPGRVTVVVMTVATVNMVHGVAVQKIVEMVAIYMDGKLDLLELVVLPPVQLQVKIAILVIVI